MRVQLNSGQVVDVPDDLQGQDALDFLDKERRMREAPGAGSRFMAGVYEGLGRQGEMVTNVAERMGLHPSVMAETMDFANAMGAAPQIEQNLQHPAGVGGTVANIAGRLTADLPMIIGAMGAARVPLGAAEALTGASILPRAGQTFLQQYPRVIGEAAVGGGMLEGATARPEVESVFSKGVGGAGEWGLGAAVLHPAFKTLGWAASKLLGRLRGNPNMTPEQAATDPNLPMVLDRLQKGEKEADIIIDLTKQGDVWGVPPKLEAPRLGLPAPTDADYARAAADAARTASEAGTETIRMGEGGQSEMILRRRGRMKPPAEEPPTDVSTPGGGPVQGELPLTTRTRVRGGQAELPLESRGTLPTTGEPSVIYSQKEGRFVNKGQRTLPGLDTSTGRLPGMERRQLPTGTREPAPPPVEPGAPMETQPELTMQYPSEINQSTILQPASSSYTQKGHRIGQTVRYMGKDRKITGFDGVHYILDDMVRVSSKDIKSSGGRRGKKAAEPVPEQVPPAAQETGAIPNLNNQEVAIRYGLEHPEKAAELKAMMGSGGDLAENQFIREAYQMAARDKGMLKSLNDLFGDDPELGPLIKKAMAEGEVTKPQGPFAEAPPPSVAEQIEVPEKLVNDLRTLGYSDEFIANLVADNGIEVARQFHATKAAEVAAKWAKRDADIRLKLGQQVKDPVTEKDLSITEGKELGKDVQEDLIGLADAINDAETKALAEGRALSEAEEQELLDLAVKSGIVPVQKAAGEVAPKAQTLGNALIDHLNLMKAKGMADVEPASLTKTGKLRKQREPRATETTDDELLRLIEESKADMRGDLDHTDGIRKKYDEGDWDSLLKSVPFLLALPASALAAIVSPDEAEARMLFHGTKVPFTQFLDKFIGSGEGAQAFGFGHYLTTRWGIAKDYAKGAVSRARSWTDQATQVVVDAPSVGGYKMPTINTYAGYTDDFVKDPEKGLAFVKDVLMDRAHELRKPVQVSINDVPILVGKSDKSFITAIRQLERGFSSMQVGKDATDPLWRAGMDDVHEAATRLSDEVVREQAYADFVRSRIEKLKQHPEPDKPRWVSNYVDGPISPNKEMAGRLKTLAKKEAEIDERKKLLKVLMDNWDSDANVIPENIQLQVYWKGGERIKAYADSLKAEHIRVIGPTPPSDSYKPYIHKVEIPDDLKLLDLDAEVPITQIGQIAEGLKKLYTEMQTTGIDPIMGREVKPSTMQKVADMASDYANEYRDEVEYKALTSLRRGRDIQHELQTAFSDMGASQFLSKYAEIKGNTYIGGTSGARNYVIFDETIPQVKKTYEVGSAATKLLALIAGAAGTAGLGTYAYYKMRDFVEEQNKRADELRKQLGSLEGQIPEAQTAGISASGLAALKDSVMAALEKTSLFARSTNQKLEGGQDILWAKNRSQINPMSEWFIDPSRMADRLGKDVSDWWARLMKADNISGYNWKNHATLFRDIEGTLSKEERLRMMDILDGSTAAKSDAEKNAYTKIRNFYDEMWGKVQESRKQVYEQNLSAEEYEAFKAVFDRGVPEEKVLSAFKDREQREVMKDVFDDFRALRDRGKIEDYVTRHELGQYHLIEEGIDSNGKTFKKIVANAVSKKDAVRKAKRYFEENPDKRSLTIDSNGMIYDLATYLPKGSYYRIINKLGKALKDDISWIEKELGYAVGDKKDMARRAVRRAFTLKPSEKFSPYLQTRKDILKGEENIFDVLPAYAMSIEKKTNLDPVIAQARKLMTQIDDPAGRQWMANLVEDVKGRYWTADRIVDNLMQKMNVDVQPMMASRAIGKIKMGEAMLKLGYRPIASLINRLSGEGHTWVKFGTETWLEAKSFMKTEEGKAFLKSVDPYMGVSYATDASGRIKPQESLIHPLGLFQAAELPNRETALAAAYLHGQKNLGMKPAEAREYAIRQNWFTQFTYNAASLPRILRTPTGRLLGQFKPYLLKEFEFIRQLSGQELARYMAFQVAMGGPRGLVMLAKSLPILGTLAAWDDLELWMNKNMPRSSRGLVGGVTGMDVTAASTFQLPTRFDDWTGPFVSDLIKIKKEVIDPLAKGEGGVGKGIWKATEGIIPIARYWPELVWDRIMTPGQKDFIIKDDRGREVYRLEWPDIIKEAAGAEPLESSRIRVAEGILSRRRTAENKQKQHLVDTYVKAVEHGDEVPQELYDELRAHNIKPAALRREMRFRRLSPLMRQKLRTELAKRAGVEDIYPTLGE